MVRQALFHNFLKYTWRKKIFNGAHIHLHVFKRLLKIIYVINYTLKEFMNGYYISMFVTQELDQIHLIIQYINMLLKL